jgi:hypothetical protein
MGVTAEQVQFYVNSLYSMILGDPVRRDAILSELEEAFKKHPKMNAVRKAELLALLKIARHPSITSLIKPASLLHSMRKHWHHRKAVTSKLVPRVVPGLGDEMDDHLVATVLRAVLKHFTPDDIDKFYSLLEKVIQFAEPHAVIGRWDQDKPLVEFTEWIPLSEYIKQTTTTPPVPKQDERIRNKQHDERSKSGRSRGGGDRVHDDEGLEEGEIKGEDTRTGPPAPATTIAGRRRGRQTKGKKEKKVDNSS